MARKKAIIIYPVLNDCGGDLSKQWNVVYSWRIPGETEMRRERIYEGLSTGTKAQRLKIAKKIIAEKTEWLKSGAYLQGNEKKVYEDELNYRHEAKLYGKVAEHVVTTRTNLSEFLSVIKQKVNAKSYESYQSKMRIFNLWLTSQKLDGLKIQNITRSNIIDFALYLSENKKLSRLTIDKYIQIIHSFFDFELERNTITSNPATKIPKMGMVVDCAAVPFHKNERDLLKEAISKADPQLWLACQIQFYCAIRPGTEIRLMKIKAIDFEREMLRISSVDAKNNTSEIVAIPSFLIEEIKFLQAFDKNLYIFGKFGRPGDEPLGKNTLRNRFNRYREALGISKEHKFYSWKHTGAITLIDNGAKPYDLKNHLRHKSFATTEGYLRKKGGFSDSSITKFSSEI